MDTFYCVVQRLLFPAIQRAHEQELDFHWTPAYTSANHTDMWGDSTGETNRWDETSSTSSETLSHLP